MISLIALTLFNWQLLIVEAPNPPTPMDLERAIDLLFPDPTYFCKEHQDATKAKQEDNSERLSTPNTGNAGRRNRSAASHDERGNVNTDHSTSSG